MKAEKLFDLIEKERLYDLREKIEERDEIGFHKKMQEQREALEATLNDEQKKLLSYFALSLENKMDQIHYEVEVYLTGYVFRLGMEMQRAFDEEDFK